MYINNNVVIRGAGYGLSSHRGSSVNTQILFYQLINAERLVGGECVYQVPMSAASPHTIQSNCRRGKLITPLISVVIRPKWSRRDDIDDLQWSVSANYGQLTKGVQISYMPITRNSSHLGSLIRD